MTGIPLTDPYGKALDFIELRATKAAPGQIKLAICYTDGGREWGPPFLTVLKEDWHTSGELERIELGEWTIDRATLDDNSKAFDGLSIFIKNSWLTSGFHLKRDDWNAYMAAFAR